MKFISMALKVVNCEKKVEEISAALDIEPTEAHNKGDSYLMKTAQGEKELFYPNSYWEYRRNYKTEEWNQPLTDLFVDEIIAPRKQKIRDISGYAEVEFFILIEFYGECNPGFHFESRILNILAEAGAELDMDLYYFNNSSRY